MSVQKAIEEWAPQMGEHALFLHLLLHEPTLKQRALDLFHKWHNYVCNGYPGDVQTMIIMLDELEGFKTEVLNRLDAGEWLGAVFPDFVDHIRFELRYFQKKLMGEKISAAEEVATWTKINADHAEFAAHLLDTRPDQTHLVDKADATSKKIRKLPTSGDLASIVMAMEAGTDLSNFNSEAYQGILENKIKSIIHPTLMRHVLREGQIGNNALGALQGKQGVPLIQPDICQTNI